MPPTVLPKDLIRTINATNADTNGWARYELGEIDREEFCRVYTLEAAALGCRVDADAVLEFADALFEPGLSALGVPADQVVRALVGHGAEHLEAAALQLHRHVLRSDEQQSVATPEVWEPLAADECLPRGSDDGG